jgi:hypothetical protein
MSILDDITLTICIDANHIDELQFAWKTWKFFKPELINLRNKILLYDTEIKHRLSELSFLDETFSIYEFKNKSYYASQRDAMLTSWFEAAKQVKTKFYMKIDTDCFATNNNNDWISAIEDRDKYKILSNPWGYTKNPQRLINLDNWGDIAINIKDYPRLNLKPNEGSNKIIHSRIISFLGVFDTDWTNLITEDCWKDDHYELPDPSQDTFTWYCAERRKDNIKRVRFKRFGFAHTRLKKIKRYFNETNMFF